MQQAIARHLWHFQFQQVRLKPIGNDTATSGAFVFQFQQVRLKPGRPVATRPQLRTFNSSKSD